MNRTLTHEGNNVREFCSALPHPVRIGIEATGWMDVVCEPDGGAGNPMPGSVIRQRFGAAEPRKQKHDRRDADLSCNTLRISSPLAGDLVTFERTTWICGPYCGTAISGLSVRTFGIQMRLQWMALANGLRQGVLPCGLKPRQDEQNSVLPAGAPHRLSAERVAGDVCEIRDRDRKTKSASRTAEAWERPGARLLMTHPGVGPVTASATEVFLGVIHRDSQTARN